jgi:hypothetical protein
LTGVGFADFLDVSLRADFSRKFSIAARPKWVHAYAIPPGMRRRRQRQKCLRGFCGRFALTTNRATLARNS